MRQLASDRARRRHTAAPTAPDRGAQAFGDRRRGMSEHSDMPAPVLGPALLALRALERPAPVWLTPARIIGKVPLFYFAVHFTLIHLVAVVVCAIRFGSIAGMFASPTLAQYPVTFPPGWGFALPVVYLAWLGVVVAIYPLCRWYAGIKQRRTDWWLSYV
jgi:hypothetical protein